MTKLTLHKASTRGYADHEWLQTHHTFSFAHYFNPERVQFGTLRVLNDDIVAGGMGFGAHPHDNMEIITVPLEGELEHQDSMGHKGVIHSGDVQIMSAGTGIRHSEYNKNADKRVNLLQIWILPKERNIAPRYDQQSYPVEQRRNDFQLVVSPDMPKTLWINQDAYVSLANLDEGTSKTYKCYRESNGLYVFVISGRVEVAGTVLEQRDGLGIEQLSEIPFKALEQAELLLLEVPMHA